MFSSLNNQLLAIERGKEKIRDGEIFSAALAKCQKKGKNFGGSAQKVPTTLLQRPSEDRQPKHKLIEPTAHPVRHNARKQQTGCHKDKEQRQETSRNEWPDFLSSSRLNLVAIVRIQSRTYTIE